MASSYSPKLGLELPAQDTQAGVWGNTLNLNFGKLIEQAIAGATVLDISLASSPFTLNEVEGTPSESRSAIIQLTGTPVTTVEIVVPTKAKVYTVRNDSDKDITVKTAAQVGGVLLKPAEATIMFCDGTVVRPGLEEILQAVLPVSGGGTGVDTFTAGFLKSPGGTQALITVPQITLSTDTKEVLPVTSGGTGVIGAVTGYVLKGDGSNPIGAVGGTTSGQWLIWNNTSANWNASTGSASGVYTVFGRDTSNITASSSDYSFVGFASKTGSGNSGTWPISITGTCSSATYTYYADNITNQAGTNCQGTRVVQSGAPSSAVSGNIWYQTS